MSAQLPLTRTPKPALDWSRPAVPSSSEFGDIYFSVDGGLEESRAVFLQGCHLKEEWEAYDFGAPFVIGELGFGSGLNFLAAWDLWNKRNNKQDGQRLDFISIEAMPWTADDLTRALNAFPSLAPLTRRLSAQWPGPVKGIHRLLFDDVSLTLFHMPAAEALGAIDGEVKAWFLDGFSPAKNPKMWSDGIMRAIANISAPHARLATFSAAGDVRRALESAGFKTERREGFGRKRHRLEAVYPPQLITKPALKPKILTRANEQSNKPVIIGGGIAGASIARAYLRRGITPILVTHEPNLETAASGNPAAMVMPRLDLQDRPESRFYLSAYLFAQQRYADTDAVLGTGALQLAQSETEQKRFQKIAANEALPPSQMRWVSTEEARALAGHGLTLSYGGLYFAAAPTIAPKLCIQEWTNGSQRIQAKLRQIEKTNGGFRLHFEDAAQDFLAQTVLVCAGADVLDIKGLAPIDVRFTRGQISYGPASTRPALALNYGGYALPIGDELLLGATHEHVSAGQSGLVNLGDNLLNAEKYKSLTNVPLPISTWKSRAAVRVTTHNTLPIAGALDDGLHVMSGLGARGFLMAPLLGEALVSAALCETSPLSLQTQKRFEPKLAPKDEN